MDIEICRKCGHWREHAILVSKEDYGIANNVAIISMCCDRCYIAKTLTFIGKDYERMREVFSRNGIRRYTRHGSRAYRRIVSSMGGKYDRAFAKVLKTDVPNECERYAEQMIEKWNKGAFENGNKK